MRLPAFDPVCKKQTDTDRFYNLDYPFVIFDDGEIWVVSDCRADPHYRRHYSNYNVSIAYLEEIEYDLVTPDTKELVQKELSHSVWTSYLVDNDEGRVYPLYCPMEEWDKPLRHYIRYSNGKYVTASSATVLVYDEPLTARHKDNLYELIHLCKVSTALDGISCFGYNLTIINDLQTAVIRSFDGGRTPHEVFCTLDDHKRCLLATLDDCVCFSQRLVDYMEIVNGRR